MPGSFTRKRINVQFNLTTGQFQVGAGGNQASVSGLRILARIENTMGATQSRCELTIFGLPLSTMNQLATLGRDYNRQMKNGLIVEAGDDESGMALVFAGVIFNAYVDGQSQPDVCLRVQGMPGAFYAVKPVKPTSVSGSADVAGLMQQFAGEMELTFENIGVRAKIANPYLPGNTFSKALNLARAAGIEMVINRGKMTIIPPNKARPDAPVLFSKDTGMVGYPAFVQANVLVCALFNPVLEPQGLFEVQSELTSANGSWKALRIEYHLEAELPQGKWFMIVEGVINGETPP